MRKQRGFTLIELLIVVAIIGIIAAIAIPNLLDAIERSRQKRSTAEVKTIAGALQAFSVDYGGYPKSTHSGAISPGSGLGDSTWVDAAQSPVFVPDYIQALPVADGWGVPYTADFAPDGTVINTRLGEVTALHFTLGSFGNDRTPSAGSNTDPGAQSYTDMQTFNADPQPATMPGTLQTHCYMTDIVWGDSSFLQAPEGKQKNCT
jgi:type II secretion system protein G